MIEKKSLDKHTFSLFSKGTCRGFVYIFNLLIKVLPSCQAIHFPVESDAYNYKGALANRIYMVYVYKLESDIFYKLNTAIKFYIIYFTEVE